MVTSITPVIQQYTPRAHSRVGDRSAYVTLEPDAYLDSTTSATQLATPTNQLSAIDYANAPDQSFTYDLNGNRTGSGNVTGADNRLTSNATWDFVYDANGNMTRRTLKSDNSYIEYTYDHRDRLTDVRYKTSAGTLTKRVHFGYDALNRRYLQTVENGSGTILSTVYYVNQGFRKDRGDAGDEIALRLDGTGAVISRYLHGSLVDEVLAEENIGSGGARDVLWAMTDHQGSVRDLARVTSGTASVVNHIVYDAFGKTVSETDAAIAHLYGYTGRELDKETGLQYNRARYLDLVLARWISQDPKSFAAGDTNLYRFVGNHPSYATDPSGLEEDYRKIFFDAAKRSAMNSVPFLTELEQEELSSVETQRRGKLSKFWEVHHWYSQDSTMGKWLTKQLPDIGSVNDPRNLSLIPYHIHTEITEEQKHFWEKISKKYELGYDRTKPYSLMASNIELLSNIEQTAIAEQYDVFVKDQKYRFSGFYLDTSMTAIDIVNVTRKSSHSLPLGLAEKAIERLAKSQPKFLGRIRDISSSLKDSAKWIKDGGKTFGLPFLAFIAASTGPIVGAATAKEDAIEDLVDHYALCLDRCRRGTEVSAHGVMDIQDLSPKFDAVAHLFGLNDEIRGFATYYFHVLSFRRK